MSEQQQNNFKYIFSGEEVSKEQFITLAKDSFKWFDNSSINAVDFDSVSNFFSGDYRSDNEIDKHFRGVLDSQSDNYFMSDHFSKVNKEQKVIEDWNRTPNVDLVMADALSKIGKKESKTVEKAPVFTYCKQMKNAIEALSLRSLYGHKKYEKGDDWENFSRVENGEFEYANAAFRHALGIGEEDERNHLIAEAWNSVAKLELFLRKDLVDRK